MFHFQLLLRRDRGRTFGCSKLNIPEKGKSKILLQCGINLKFDDSRIIKALSVLIKISSQKKFYHRMSNGNYYHH